MHEVPLLLLAALVFGYALLSRRAEKGIVSPPMVFAGAGLLFASFSDGLFSGEPPAVPEETLRFLAEVTLALTLFMDAARIDVSRLKRFHAEPVRMLLVGLPLSMLLGGVAAWLLFPPLGVAGAALLGVILAPTDAALGKAVVSNPSVPQRVRQTLNVESGLNDGLAFPVLLIVVSFAAADGGRSLPGWGGFLAGQLILGPLVGLSVGFFGARALRLANRRGWVEDAWLRLSSLALVLLAYLGAEAIGGNGFIAAFCGGLAFGAAGGRGRRGEESDVSETETFGDAEGDLLSLVVFFLVGAVLLPDALGDAGWRHALYAALSLTAVRMLPVALCLLGLGLKPVTLGFLGWFGPRGMASVIYLLLVRGEHDVPGEADLTAAVLLTVAASILLHGVSASPLSSWYAGRMEDGGGDRREHREVTPHLTR